MNSSYALWFYFWKILNFGTILSCLFVLRVMSTGGCKMIFKWLYILSSVLYLCCIYAKVLSDHMIIVYLSVNHSKLNGFIHKCFRNYIMYFNVRSPSTGMKQWVYNRTISVAWIHVRRVVYIFLHSMSNIWYFKITLKNLQKLNSKFTHMKTNSCNERMTYLNSLFVLSCTSIKHIRKL